MTILLKIRKKDWITLCHHERDGKKDLAIICTMFCTNTAKADTDLPWDESEIAETSTCVVNGVERSLTILKNTHIYLKLGDSSSIWEGG